METSQVSDGATDRLVRTTMLAGLVPAVVLGVLALVLIHPVVGVLVLVVVAGSWAALVWTRTSQAAGRVVAPLGAAEVPPGTEPRLENLLEGVCMVGGIAEPKLLALADPGLNALAVADGAGASFVVTRGLVDELGRVELEGVLANLAARVKSGSARYAAVVLALPVPSSYAGKLLRDGLGEQSSVRSDLAAVGLTKYPPGLISALAVMEERGTAVASAPRTAAPLWLADPTGEADPSPDEVDPQPLSLRIAVLSEL